MNLRHLEIFYALATTGSLTGAARPLDISQPVVTIRALPGPGAGPARPGSRAHRRMR